MYLYGLSLFTLTNTWLFLNFSIVTNNTVLFGNTYYTMYGPNHFLVNFPRCDLFCRNPTFAKCEDETHTPKVGDLESSGTSKCLEFDNKAQNTSHWGVIGVIGKVLKCRCPKWPRIGHLDICSPSYEQKKGWESNWQFDFRPLKVRNRPVLDVRSRSAKWH
jgi:hypothetical protein